MPQKKPFRVFEAGCGSVPWGLIRKASRSLEKAKNREFTGVDSQKINLNRLLVAARLPKPKNLAVMQKDAIKALQELKPESQDVIFASYLCNCLSGKTTGRSGKRGDIVFLEEAKRALRHGGRLVLVQDKAHTHTLREIALGLGMGFHAIEIPDKIASKSPAKFIRKRSSPLERAKITGGYLAENPKYFALSVRDSVEKKSISSPEEYAKPTMMMLRKPRKGEAKIQAITAIGVIEKITELSPAEQREVKQILGIR